MRLEYTPNITSDAMKQSVFTEAPIQLDYSELVHTLGRGALDGFMTYECDHRSEMAAAIHEELSDAIIGQPAAIDAIADAFDRSEVRSENDHRPKACLAFLGPTGVGKSETAKVLAQVLSESTESSLIKVDGSSYSQGHEVANLTGSPLGYVGSNVDPLLCKKNVEKPGTVILFDEIEKGAPELHRLLLQIMGDGELKMKNGKTVNFRDAIVILTSNLGAREMQRELADNSLGFGVHTPNTDRTSLETTATKAFKQFFDPELINRLDKLVVFHGLNENDMGIVLDSKLATLNDEYIERFGAQILLSDAAKAHIVAEAAKTPELGGRALIRAFESHVLNSFGRYVGAGNNTNGVDIKFFHARELGDEHEMTAPSSLVLATRPNYTIKKSVPSKEIQPVQSTTTTPQHGREWLQQGAVREA